MKVKSKGKSHGLTLELHALSDDAVGRAKHFDLVRVVDLDVERASHDGRARVQDLNRVAACQQQVWFIERLSDSTVKLAFNSQCSNTV